MKNLISITKVLAMAVAMFSFAASAWAEHDGDGVVHDADEVTDTEVIGEEEVIGEDGMVDESDVTTGEEVELQIGGDDGIIYTMTGEGGEVPATEYVDAEGNVIYFRSDEGGGEEVEMTALMSQSGAAGGAVSLADTAADQAGIDSAPDLSLDVVDSTQADFAAPVEVATVAADGSVSASHGGTATRISGGHLGSQQ